MPLSSNQRTKYIELADKLRQEIHSGQMKAGDRLPPYGEAQQLYKTTKATIQRVHALLEQDGLVVRRPGSGVYVASKQRRPQTGLIGLVHAPMGGQGGFPGMFHSSYESRLLNAIRGTALEAGIDVLLLHPKPSPGWEKVDGVLVHGNGAESILEFGARIPTVVMMHSVDAVTSVIADDRKGARQATEHLLSLGHQRIAYLLDTSEGNPLSGQRLDGYRQALGNAHIIASPDWVAELKNYGDMHKRGYLSMRRWLRQGFEKSGCTALLVQNDLAAIGAMEALREAGISVPKQLSVIGFDNTDECKLLTPQLTSVHVPLENIGARAISVLLHQISQYQDPAIKSDSSPIVLPTKLVVRQSTAPPPHL